MLEPEPSTKLRDKLYPYIDHIPQHATRGPTKGQAKRVRADRSRQLTGKDAMNGNNAALFAIHQGMRLNVFLTVVLKHMRGKNGWRKGEPPAAQVPKQRGIVLRALADFCRYRGFPFAYACVVESQQGPASHLHILMHLPEDAPPSLGSEATPDPTWHRYRVQLLDALNRKSGWTQAELEQQARRKAKEGSDGDTWLPIDILPIHLFDGGATTDTTAAMLRYMVKPISPDEVIEHGGKRLSVCEFAGPLQEDMTLRPSADTYCRRMLTISENLSIGARKAAGWVDTRDMAWLNRRIEHETRKEDTRRLLKQLSDKKKEFAPLPDGETADLNKDTFARGQDVADILLKAMHNSCLEANG